MTAAPTRKTRTWRRGLLALAALAAALPGTLVAVKTRDAMVSLPTADQLPVVLSHPLVRLRAGPDGRFTGAACVCPLFLRKDELPRHLLAAIVAIEDPRFFTHAGLDWLGIGRALLADLVRRRIVEGGSTLTQQLAKTLVGAETTLDRKIREAVLARRIESVLGKEDILLAYANRVYFGTVAGQPISGVEAAARAYFGKRARALNLLEAAMLAGMVQAPGLFHPAEDAKRAHDRARKVLARMVEEGFITAQQADAAERTGLRPGRLPPAGIDARHFMQWIARLAMRR